MSLPCILVMRQQHIYLVFSVFTSRPTSLQASVKVSVFFFMVSMLSPSRFTSSAETSSWCVPVNFSPAWFSWTFLMAYSEVMLCQNPHWSPIIHVLNLERRILEKIQYEVYNSDIPWWLPPSVLSPLLWIDTIIDSFHWSGNSSLLQIDLIGLRISDHNISPPAWISSVGIWSLPVTFLGD
jgi:hypothetical protein